MSKGSDRITVRMGTSFRQAIEAYCDEREDKSPMCEKWGFSDFILQAIADKLNHIERGRKSGVKWRIVRADERSPVRLQKIYKRKVVCQQAAAAIDEGAEAKEVATQITENFTSPIYPLDNDV